MFFDLHLHPSTKAFLSGPTFGPKKHDCWHSYNNFLLDVADSQSSLSQLKDGRVHLAVACIYVFETPFTANFLLQHVLPSITYLHQDALRFQQNDSPFKRLMEELKLLQASNQPNGKEFNIISQHSEVEPGKINLVLAIEGSHCLGSEDVILPNLDKLKNSEHRFLYLTLTHLTRTDCASHAYNIKLIKKNDEFKPAGGGLYPFGKQVIDRAYDKSVGGHHLFIDIKHMSLLARQQFYEYREEKGYTAIPIIASHVGCTGFSWNKIESKIQSEKHKSFNIIPQKFPENKKYARIAYKKVKGLSDTTFNPVSINIYDEEIRLIVESGGLIGLILDRKALGLKTNNAEFFELNELNTILGRRDFTTRDDEDFEDETGTEADPNLNLDLSPKDRPNYEEHFKYLANQILHVVRMGGAQAWKHLCIGSDFDGMISPGHNCINTTEYPLLAAELPRVLKEMINANPGIDFHVIDLIAQVKDIMFDNANEFLKKWFNPTPQV